MNERRLFIIRPACKNTETAAFQLVERFVFVEFCEDPPCWPPCDSIVDISVIGVGEEAGEA